MKRLLAAYAAAVFAFAALDAVWLRATGAGPAQTVLAPMLAHAPSPAPAIMFYVVCVAGVTLFAARPALEARRWTRAPCLGGAFGLVAYATYDLAAQARLGVWAPQIMLADLAWGSFATAAAASAGYWAARAAGPWR